MSDPVSSLSGLRSRVRAPRVTRAAVSVVVAVGLVGGAVVGIRTALEDDPVPAQTWFAPYVDVTLTPSHPFEDPSANPSEQVVLGFVVADTTGRPAASDAGCTPAWGGVYGPDEAATALDLDRRIARYRERGGDVVVSFGGVANEELAVSCADEAVLEQAYRTVVDRYGVSTIDLDIEGPALDDVASVGRRARAVAALQREVVAGGGQLDVWLTLPVAPTGMLDDALAVVDATLAAGVELGGVNIMTMDFGGARPASLPMAEAVVRSLTESHRQLGAAYRRAGQPLDDVTLWGKLGATPMVGVNDVVADVFTPGDARALVAFARERGVGRASMWSANRDAPCPGGPDPTKVSNTCSGVAQAPLEFSRILGRVGGRALTEAPETTTTATAASTEADDPAASPHPVWVDAQVYREGERVVWHRKVYMAKWWTQGDDPDDAATGAPASPWRLVGPVLDSDQATTTTTLAADTYPAWDPETAYRAGDRVLHAGVGYQARWFAQGIDPSAPPTDDGPSPWEPLAGR